MSQNRGVLLASFLKSATEDQIYKEVEFIVNNLNLTNKFIFLLEDTDNPDNKFLTYNAVVSKDRTFNPRLYTIRVHRKKQTNTLYTINALNKAVALEHDGKTGRHLKLSWENYKDTILLTAGKDLKVHNISVSKIFKIEDGPAPESDSSEGSE
tara:strand:+ start:3809 stop:4267 length:459 start_codon:yes stop_codon:yes gene_type:complete